MKHILLFCGLFIVFFTLNATAFAQECERVGQCVGNHTCLLDRNNDGDEVLVLSLEANCGSSSIGGVRPPGAIYDVNNAVAGAQGGTGRGDGIGIIIFISNLLRLFAVVAGIWAMFNLIMGGYTYITSMSDAGAAEKVRQSMTMTVIGLAIIAGGYIIAAVIGALMFGNPNFILQPTLQGALQ